MKFNKSKCKVLHLGQGNSRYEYRPGEEAIERSPEGKDLGVLVEEKLDMSQQHAATAQKAQTQPVLQQNSSGQQVKRGDTLPLLCCHETPSGVLHPAFHPQHNKDVDLLREASEEGHKDNQKEGPPLL
ncbi:sodium glucose cotransporter 1-like [Willisornis vidua]|uniref:Sodium glucose cotransporter 1-like n=1 Tax=Willisornis vidua TaxID=1566151 RepID=A0ABQ9CTB9_9PASS|nr:sodium glucose cotransporter 1-like [Willisornis vidua]